MAKHNKTGEIGEEIATKWLVGKGFVIIDKNYRKKWGEIDIVARETMGKVHFVEVKTVSYETKQYLDHAVSHETWRPEDNVHFQKQRRMARTIETWLSEFNYSGEWQIDILTVRIVSREKYCRIKFMNNIIFEL